MAKPNYRFDKRQRELKKNKRQEEKRLKKLARGESQESGAESEPESPTADQSTDKRE